VSGSTQAMRERLQRFDAAKLVDVRVCGGATGKSTRVRAFNLDPNLEPREAVPNVMFTCDRAHGSAS